MQVGTFTDVPGDYRQKALWLQALPTGSVNLGMDSEQSKFQRLLGATILELRVAAGIPSQKALSVRLQEMGVTTSEATVRRWEQGRGSPPDAWEINRMAALFGVDPDELVRPAAMTDREMQLLRRVGRQVHRTIAREREVS